MNYKNFFFLIALSKLFGLIASSSARQADEEEVVFQKTLIFFDFLQNFVVEYISQESSTSRDGLSIVEFVETFPQTLRAVHFMNILDYFKNVQLDNIYELVKSFYFKLVVDASPDVPRLQRVRFNDYCIRFGRAIDEGVYLALERIKSRIPSLNTAIDAGFDFDLGKEDEEDEDGYVFIPIDVPSDTHTHVFEAEAKVIENPRSDLKEEESLFIPFDENSDRFSNTKISFDLAIKAVSSLNFGVHEVDPHFPAITAFLRFVSKNSIPIVDPRRLNESQYFSEFIRNFDIIEFKKLCGYMNLTTIPITSVFYVGPRKPTDEKLKMKHALLLELARVESLRIINELDIELFTTFITLKDESLDPDIVEFIIGTIKISITEFLMKLKQDSSFILGLETSISEAISSAAASFGMQENPEMVAIYKESFINLFESPSNLIKKYDSISEWMKYYLTDSTGTDSSFSTSPTGRKSVTISETEEIIPIERREHGFLPIENADVIRGLKRSSSLANNLSDLDTFDFDVPTLSMSSASSSSDDGIEFPKVKLSEYPVKVPDFPFDVPDFPFEVPDFPFENPAASIVDESFLMSTIDYAIKHGDDSRFMLRNRLDTLKMGLAQFLSDSFESVEVVEFTRNLFAKELDALFLKNYF